MRFGYREACLDHQTGPRHPESPDRLRAIRRVLAECHNVEYVAGDPCDVEDVSGVHDGDYVEKLQAFCDAGGGNWDADTVAVEATWDAALSSAGLAEWAASAALDGADGRQTPFSIGRPPGHHAVEDDAMGFCFFNNTAVAAQCVIDAGDADRVAIFDWDVHHGNGTQDIFYDREDVLYASIHEEGLFPGTGHVEETGAGDGEGATLNVPFPPGAEDPEYLAAVDDLVRPAVEAHDPDLFLISAGFDAHEHDPISRMGVSTEGYGLLARAVRDVADDADAALAFVLEGGYGLDTLSQSIRTVHEVFDGYEPAPADGDTQDRAHEVIEEVRETFFEG